MRLEQASRFVLHLLLVLLAILSSGCGDREDAVPAPAPEAVGQASQAPRLVLLYAPCTVGKQFLSPWNDSISFTPNLAAFAARSTVFERHQTETGQSGISYASIFSGSQADHHRVFRHPARLRDGLFLITEAYAEAGYETFYWNGHRMASAKLNYAQGVAPKNRYARGLVAEDPHFVAILQRLARDPDYKAFIVTNFSRVTHGPYPKLHVARFMREYPNESLGVTPEDVEKYADLYRDNHLGLTWNQTATLERLGIGDDLPRFANVIEVLYRANINQLDRLFGQVIDAIDAHELMDESLIAFTADHGEVLYRESATFKWTHSMLLDHEVLGVPWILHAPQLPRAGSRYPGVTRSIDVFPTLAGLSGIELPAESGVRGVDLSEILVGGLPAADLIAFSHTTVLVKGVHRQMYEPAREHHWLEARKFFPDERFEHVWVALRAGDDWFKYRKLEDGSWATQAFDLAVDPDANHDVFDPGNQRHAAMRRELLAYKAMLARSYASPGAGSSEQALPAEREEDLLRRLGYIE